METLNEYGFVSGGWLYDQMDRCALDALKRVVGGGFWFTHTGVAEYLKQCCMAENSVFTAYIKNIVGDRAQVVVECRDKEDDNILYCLGTFKFVMKGKSYCEGVTNENG